MTSTEAARRLRAHTWRFNAGFVCSSLGNLFGRGKRTNNHFGQSVWLNNLFFFLKNLLKNVGQYNPKFMSKCGSVWSGIFVKMWVSIIWDLCQNVGQYDPESSSKCGSVSSGIFVKIWVSLVRNLCQNVGQFGPKSMSKCGLVWSEIYVKMWVSMIRNFCKNVGQYDPKSLSKCGSVFNPKSMSKRGPVWSEIYVEMWVSMIRNLCQMWVSMIRNLSLIAGQRWLKDGVVTNHKLLHLKVLKCWVDLPLCTLEEWHCYSQIITPNCH